MFVSEVYQRAQDALGKCNETAVFEAITDAVRVINNQSDLDLTTGWMDICTCEGCITLPPEVGTVLSVNIGGFTTLLRDQFFQFNISGAGSQGCTPCFYTDELGAVVTYRDPAGPVKLVAQVESAQDNQKQVRVFAKYQGKPIYTPNKQGQLQEGFLVPTIFGFFQPNPNAGFIDEIYRIQKDVTNGFVNLLAVNADGTAHTRIGQYAPWETIPSYRRIRVGNASWVRVSYKKRDLRVRAQTDWINIDNDEALILAIKAVKFRKDNQFDTARAAEAECIRLINNQAENEMPGGIKPINVMNNDFPVECQNDRLIY